MSLLETKGGDNYFWQRDYGAGDDGDRCRLFTIDPISGTIHTWISEPSAPYFIVRQNSLPGGNTSDILRNASQVNCPALQYNTLPQHFTVKC